MSPALQRGKPLGIGIDTSVKGLIIAAIAAEMIAHSALSVFGVRVFGGPD